MRPFILTLLLCNCLISTISVGQNLDTVTSGRFDNGKMWTFDTPPIEYLTQTYGFTPSQGWIDSARMSALRFATYCSASFVSQDGLVMTNHHCARESGTAVQRKGEDFNKDGFYAAKLADERRVPNLFVDQLIKLKDVTIEVKEAMARGTKKKKKIILRDSIIKVIKEKYKLIDEWKGLELQVAIFYKGAKFSLYGFKRHTDVRLVFVPELQLGFFGGDPDNFTYPRYALDCSFFRVYDQNGKPIKTNYFFKFDPNGIRENEPVFVIGNPGRTDRLSTMSQLNFFKEQLLPVTLMYLKNRGEVLRKFNVSAKSDSVLNRIFSIENSRKAITGQLNGLHDPYIYAKKSAFEKEFKNKVGNNPALSNKLTLWSSIDSCRSIYKTVYPSLFLFQPSTMAANGLEISKKINEYVDILKVGKDTTRIKILKKELEAYKPSTHLQLEKDLLLTHFEEASQLLAANDEYWSKVNASKPFAEYVNKIVSETKLYQVDFVKSILKSQKDSILILPNDPLISLGGVHYNLFKNAKKSADEVLNKETLLHSAIAQLQFEVYGNQIPPDANFNLRIADGIVKGYRYNGTEAPIQTTFFGLYDRYYSNKQTFPWSLPEKWKNPTKELLRSPMNFVSTNDIIGGNSGSPMINKKRKAVGLIFDGNIESLPGRFIYLDELNRTVSVHTGGILAALKDIYKAKRIYNELIK